MKKLLTTFAAAYITLFSVTEAVALPHGECNFMADLAEGTVALRYNGVSFRDARFSAARYLGQTLGSTEYQHIPHEVRQRWADILAPFLSIMVTTAYNIELTGSYNDDAAAFGDATYEVCRGW